MRAAAGTAAAADDDDNGRFASRAYWERRFVAEEQHDWLSTYDRYAHVLRPQVRRGRAAAAGTWTDPRADRPVRARSGAPAARADPADGPDPRPRLRHLDAERAAPRGRLP